MSQATETNRRFDCWRLLLLALTFTACSHGPRYVQLLAVEGDAADGARYLGTWYDFRGVRTLAIGRDSDGFRLRLENDVYVPVVRAQARPDGLHLWARLPDGGLGEGVYRIVEEHALCGSAVDAARPYCCGWDLLRRDLTLRDRWEIAALRTSRRLHRVCDELERWLVEKL